MKSFTSLAALAASARLIDKSTAAPAAAPPYVSIGSINQNPLGGSNFSNCNSDGTICTGPQFDLLEKDSTTYVKSWDSNLGGPPPKINPYDPCKIGFSFGEKSFCGQIETPQDSIAAWCSNSGSPLHGTVEINGGTCRVGGTVVGAPSNFVGTDNGKECYEPGTPGSGNAPSNAPTVTAAQTAPAPTDQTSNGVSRYDGNTFLKMGAVGSIALAVIKAIR
jgi:hypothetical protein